MQFNFLILFIFINILIYKSECVNGVQLEILANDKNVTRSYYDARAKESLRLTCKLVGYNESYHLGWKPPKSIHTNQNRVRPNVEINEASLDIFSVQKTDKGEYICICRELNMTAKMYLNVKVTPSHCGTNMFICERTQNCIYQHYACDGKIDCKFGEDEQKSLCGNDPCEGKIRCEGRCIPVNWCCLSELDPNCTIKERPRCCQIHFKFNPKPVPEFREYHSFKHSLLKATVFTLFVCAVTFFFLISICLLVICRIHIHSCPANQDIREVCSRTRIPFYDLYLYLNRNWNNPDHSSYGYRPQLRNGPSAVRPQPRRTNGTNNNYNLVDNGFDIENPNSSSPLPHRILLMSYLNNEVQYIHRPASPPPYSEICDTSNVTRAAGTASVEPPPPYVSHENLNCDNLLVSSDGEDCGGDGREYVLVTTRSDEEEPQNDLGETSCGVYDPPTVNDNDRSEENSNFTTEIDKNIDTPQSALSSKSDESPPKYDIKKLRLKFLGAATTSNFSSNSECSISSECDSLMISPNRYSSLYTDDVDNNNSIFSNATEETTINLRETHLDQFKLRNQARPRSLNCDSPIVLDNGHIDPPRCLVKYNSGNINSFSDHEDNAEARNKRHSRPLIGRHSIADLSPSGSNEYRYFEIPSYDRETRLLTLPLRESFIGLRKE